MLSKHLNITGDNRITFPYNMNCNPVKSENCDLNHRIISHIKLGLNKG